MWSLVWPDHRGKKIKGGIMPKISKLNIFIDTGKIMFQLKNIVLALHRVIKACFERWIQNKLNIQSHGFINLKHKLTLIIILTFNFKFFLHDKIYFKALLNTL